MQGRVESELMPRALTQYPNRGDAVDDLSLARLRVIFSDTLASRRRNLLLAKVRNMAYQTAQSR